MIRVVLADNQAIFRAGVARVLSTERDIRILAQCDNTPRLLHLAATSNGCVLVVTTALAVDFDRLYAAAQTSSSRLILMTDTAEEPAPAVSARLDGLLTRHATADTLVTCVRRVAAGERALNLTGSHPFDEVGQRMCELLTIRELQIVGCVVQGYRNRQIAEAMSMGEQVVKNYLRAIFDKTGSSDRLELALFTLHHRALAQAAARAAGSLPKVEPST